MVLKIMKCSAVLQSAVIEFWKCILYRPRNYIYEC